LQDARGHPHLVFITDFSHCSISDSFHIKELREFKHGGLVKGCPTPRRFKNLFAPPGQELPALQLRAGRSSVISFPTTMTDCSFVKDHE
jgi:hypothetical protein